MHSTECDIYGCRNRALVSPTGTDVVIDGEMVNLEVCDEHRAFFSSTSPERYNIGRTFTGEVEVRPVPAKSVDETE